MTSPDRAALADELEAARNEIVLTIAFLGRDAGTERLSGTIDGLIKRLAAADKAILAALRPPSPYSGAVGEVVSNIRAAITNAAETLRIISNDRKRYGAISTAAQSRGWQLSSALKDIDALLSSAPTTLPRDAERETIEPDDDWEERGAADKLRRAVIERCAKIVEGQVVHHNCREWPAASAQGNRADDSEIVRHCDRLARAIRNLSPSIPSRDHPVREAIKPHVYTPDYQAMGDCRVCGHGQNQPWHLYSPSPTSVMPDEGKQK